MTDYEAGYRARFEDLRVVHRMVEDHFKGVRVCDRSGDWFNGWQDASDDIAQKNPPMYAVD